MINDMNISTDIGAIEPMDDTELQGIVSAELEDAVSYIDSDVSPIRAKGTEYYRGDPFGNEEDGRSQVVAMEVRDTVSAMLPSLMKVFFSSENVVEYVPRGPEDVSGAQQATDYANYIFSNDNNGFMTTYALFKDSLVRKCGIAKYWWEDNEEVKIEEYSGLDDQTVQILMQEDAEVKIVVSYPDPSMQVDMMQQQVDPATGLPIPVQMPMLHDVQIKRNTKDGRIRIMAVPPEELILDRRARSFDDAGIIAHRQMATVSDLIGMGYDQEEIEENISSTDLDSNDEYLARQPLSTTMGAGDSMNPMQQRVLYVEAYMRVDFDGDGVAELRKICCMGSGYTMVRNLPASYIPFVDFPCDPEPHTSPLEAMSIFDVTHDIQEIKSEIMRNTLDSLAQSIHPRTAVVEGQVNIDDVLNNETGAIIRMRAPGMVTPFSTPFVGQAAFPMLDYMDQMREDRTGMSKAAMGLDPDALQSTTKAAVAATVSASNSRLELQARILAEGMKKLFKGILYLMTTHQDKPRMVRLRNEWVQIDPRVWDAGMDVNVNIGLGNGDLGERMQGLTMIAGKQEQIMQQFGLSNPVVTPSMYIRTIQKIVELSGFKDASSYFQDLPADFQMPQSEPKPTPEEVLAQVQAQSIQADIQKKAAELELKREQMIRDDDYRRDQLAQDLVLKKYELELKYGAQISTAEIDAQQSMDREAMQQQTALVQQAVQAANQVQAPPVEQMPPINLNGMVQ
ncbi:hypothetical protein UFOVP588_44 [uncultured Caudovirales phage]|uniref:Uncharacterized protein n=1 Tax=uncultured Caudovirales phage TaxID=2100421 RepID=A0A6J5N072_9CAUD|nr:hypothetical protein UFOVP588_44 [uncultured Caudovirales phage]